jgi:raffinose/stachyose/melibiose transport system permease protein
MASSDAQDSLQWPRLIGVGGAYLALLAILLQTIYPLLWVLFGSLKTNEELISNVWGLPQSLRFDNYVQAWQIAQLGTKIVNSAIVTVLALAIIVVVATPCAYALARMRFPGRGVLLSVIIAAMLVPAQIIAIPLFLVARDLGLVNSLPGVALVIAAGGLPISIFILRGFFLSLPVELEDAARVDGAGRFTIMTRIILPLARPGVALVVIVQFIDVWNEFFVSLLLLRKPEVQTIPLGLVNFFQEYASFWSYYFAALTITILPVIVVFVLMQRLFIAGLTAGAIRG